MGASVMYSMDRSTRNLNRNITSIIQYVNSNRSQVKKEAS
jgi:hypothetical protein